MEGHLVYAVLRKKDYSLVNIHLILDQAMAQIVRLEVGDGSQSINVSLDIDGAFQAASSLDHIIQPYWVESKE